jgi:hypothetical protein
MRSHIRYPDKAVSHCVECGSGDFYKRSPDVLYCKQYS